MRIRKLKRLFALPSSMIQCLRTMRCLRRKIRSWQRCVICQMNPGRKCRFARGIGGTLEYDYNGKIWILSYSFESQVKLFGGTGGAPKSSLKSSKILRDSSSAMGKGRSLDLAFGDKFTLRLALLFPFFILPGRDWGIYIDRLQLPDLLFSGFLQIWFSVPVRLIDSRVESPSGFEHTVNDAQQLVHTDTQSRHFAFAFCETVHKEIFDNRISRYGYQGAHK